MGFLELVPNFGSKKILISDILVDIIQGPTLIVAQLPAASKKKLAGELNLS